MTTKNRTIVIEGVTRRFGRKPVLRGIDLEVNEGEFLSIFGPNGAGKTTLIKVMATLLKPSAGTVHVAGLDLRENPIEIRRRIGVVSHQTFLYDELTAYENLKYYGKMYDVPHLKEQIHELISRVGLESRLHDRVRTLSRGMQQRLSIARAMIHNPPIILLDEPETGLDQYAGEMLLEVLAAQNPVKRTVVMTTHNLERGLEMGSHIAILAKGKIAYEESKQSLNLASLQEAYLHHTGAGQ
ncbi:heme ABC exporter ATP-binding protein CcmA [Chloroflexota bacterium]